MNTQEAIKIIWDYMRLGHELQKADLIVVFGSHDIRVAEYAAELWKESYAPYIVFSGSGTIHTDNPAWKEFVGSTEAEVFAHIAEKAGVSKEAIIIENQSQNTGDNFSFTKTLLAERGIEFEKVILVQKPFMERRVFAATKVQWPDKEIVVTSPPLSLDEYKAGANSDWWIHAMVGDLQRIKEYPKRGYQIEQEIPNEVWEAFECLVAAGYDMRLLAN